MSDPLDAFDGFTRAVRARLEKGRAEYGDRSFSREPAELLCELQQEALDLAGWGFVLWRRLERAVSALESVALAVPAAERGESGPVDVERVAGAALLVRFAPDELKMLLQLCDRHQMPPEEMVRLALMVAWGRTFAVPVPAGRAAHEEAERP